jgi:hypothetical protein
LVVATEVIVGNAPMELSGVRGGLLQVGGSLGTAVLGAPCGLPAGHEPAGNWKDAGLTPLPPAQAHQASGAVRPARAPATSDQIAMTRGAEDERPWTAAPRWADFLRQFDDHPYD